MIINHNLSALNAYGMFRVNSFRMDQTAEKISSGLRINKAADDPSGLSVSEKMRSQIRGLRKASQNTQDAISFVQTTEGYLNETMSLLQRMRELSVQASNGIYTREDRLQMQVEIEQLVDEVDRISSQAEFNNIRMLKGGFRRSPETTPAEAIADDTDTIPAETNSAERPEALLKSYLTKDSIYKSSNEDIEFDKIKGGVIFHLGPNQDQRERLFIEDMSAPSLGLAKVSNENKEIKINLTNQASANVSIYKLDAAISYVSKQRADLGAFQNRMESALRGIETTEENMIASESRIRDTDIAKEMVDYVRYQILTQASATLVSQANMRPQFVLKVLG